MVLSSRALHVVSGFQVRPYPSNANPNHNPNPNPNPNPNLLTITLTLTLTDGFQAARSTTKGHPVTSADNAVRWLSPLEALAVGRDRHKQPLATPASSNRPPPHPGIRASGPGPGLGEGSAQGGAYESESEEQWLGRIWRDLLGGDAYHRVPLEHLHSVFKVRPAARVRVGQGRVRGRVMGGVRVRPLLRALLAKSCSILNPP